MYRQHTQQPITPSGVAGFLLLDPDFPRSVRYCLNGLATSLEEIQQQPLHKGHKGVSHLLGPLRAHWNYARVDDVINGGLHEVIDDLQIQLNHLHGQLESRYFAASSCTSD
jgi:uncharacterized alpha-E superfamily protein